MNRKLTILTLAFFLVVGGLISVASAAQNVANTNQKGSLLIFPRIEVLAYNPQDPVPGYRDTIITLANDYYREVWVKCYWVDKDQEIQDFMFQLTPNQPIYFSAQAGTGPGVTVPPFMGNRGELKCWAVDPSGREQISFNHLYGSARVYVLFPAPIGAFEYNAWSFTARGVPLGGSVGTVGGELDLTGLDGGYDACPQYLLTTFSPSNPSQSELLTLVPCKQDLRQDRVPTCTKAKFDVWNSNETKFTGSYQCLKCWYEGYLADIGKDPTGYGGANFTQAGLSSEVARFRVQGVASTVCKNKFLTPGNPDLKIPPADKCTGGQVASPLLGLHALESPMGSSLLMTGAPLFTAGSDGSGWIKWDPNFDVPTAPVQ